MVLAFFVLMIAAMLWAGVASVRQARLLHLRWVGYGQGIGWFAVGCISLLLLALSIYSLIVRGLPDSFEHVSLISWVWIAGNFAFALWVAVTMELSVRNLKHMTKETIEQFAETKRAMQQLKHQAGHG